MGDNGSIDFFTENDIIRTRQDNGELRCISRRSVGEAEFASSADTGSVVGGIGTPRGGVLPLPRS